ncbi:cation:proton antiporter [Crateriforma spongiae]|uniref:cation:proton antiporter n=1 Tax=Crateriforma spongiae TaxID=2724528 RepID=UPI001445D839|nr:sodium:proton antiporter [Crateriforma spongiae]
MDLLFYLALVPSLGSAAQWLAHRTNLPSILLLLLFGVGLGQFINPDDFLAELTGGDATAGPKLLFPLVSLSVGIIMFEGGLSLRLEELRESGSAALRLVTIGAAVTMAGVTIAAHQILDFPWRMSLLLGAILVVTGPTVIGPLLRHVRPSRRVASALKWEGIVIDPIGAVLAVLVFEQAFLHGDDPSLRIALGMLAWTSLVGVVLGVLSGWLMTLVLRKFWLPDMLHGVAALSFALLMYAISDQLAHESGLITVTVMGIWLINQKQVDVEHVVELKENLRTLLIGCLFVLLGSRVDINNVIEIGWPGLLFLGVLILVVRPLSVYLSLIGSPLNYREQTFIAGLAPRGIVAAAVSSIFALELQRNAVEGDVASADQLVTVTFLVIVGTVAVYGMLASPLAKFLQLADENNHGVLIAGADAWVREFAGELQANQVHVMLVDTNYNKISQAKMDGLSGVCMNILNEHAREELNLAGIGRMMAMTPNDEVNTLSLRECRTLFDRSRLYQLTFSLKNSHGRRGLTKNLLGRELFGEGMTFSAIAAMHQAGATFKSTKLTDAFTYDDFMERYGEDTVLLCVIKDDNSLSINTVGDPLRPVSGQTVLALVHSVPVPPDHAVMQS